MIIFSCCYSAILVRFSFCGVNFVYDFLVSSKEHNTMAALAPAAKARDHVSKVTLDARVLRSMQLGKAFQGPVGAVTSMDFSDTGDLLITSSEDESIRLYDCHAGKERKHIYSKKYGVNHVRFTHNNSSIIHASTKIDDTIRYLSLHDNKYIRYFVGHKNRVSGLCVSPLDDTFLSSSEDCTVRLWDLRSQNCQGLLNCTSTPVVAYDPQGVAFAVGLNSEKVKLYDIRSFDKGPFDTFEVKRDPTLSYQWRHMQFSADGKHLLISTDSNLVFLLDAFQGSVKMVYGARSNSSGRPIEASFSPDAQFVLSGSDDGQVHVWETQSGHEVVKLVGAAKPVTTVRHNPKLLMLVSAGAELGFWLSGLDSE
eukprot:Colp12_sorted_trinity150504_noHs@24494